MAYVFQYSVLEWHHRLFKARLPAAVRENQRPDPGDGGNRAYGFFDSRGKTEMGRDEKLWRDRKTSVTGRNARIALFTESFCLTSVYILCPDD